MIPKNISTVVAGAFLGVITFTIHAWNRVSNNVVSLPTTEEKSIALLIFIATISMTYALPFVGSFFFKKRERAPSWPISETILIVGGILFAMAFISISGLIPGFFGVSQDVIGVFIGYVFMVVAYWSAVQKAAAGCRTRSWAKLVTTGGVAVLAAVIILIAGWMLVHFE